MEAHDQTRAESEPTQNNQPPKMVEEKGNKKIQKEGGVPFAGVYGVRDLRSRDRMSICMFIVIFLILVGITALTLWLVYRPHEPKFRVISAAIYNELNATSTSPPSISTTMQFTLVIRNPNSRVSIYYENLSAFVSYKNQAITPPLILPPLFQETKSTVAVSPVLGGTQVPVSEEVVSGLMMDQAYGVVGLSLVLRGKLRYKSGGIIKSSGSHGIVVRCDTFVGLKKDIVGQLSLLGSNLGCTVDV